MRVAEAAGVLERELAGCPRRGTLEPDRRQPPVTAHRGLRTVVRDIKDVRTERAGALGLHHLGRPAVQIDALRGECSARTASRTMAWVNRHCPCSSEGVAARHARPLPTRRGLDRPAIDHRREIGNRHVR